MLENNFLSIKIIPQISYPEEEKGKKVPYYLGYVNLEVSLMEDRGLERKGKEAQSVPHRTKSILSYFPKETTRNETVIPF